MKKYRAFLLLELMIALFLVLLCILPFVDIPTKIATEELLFMQRLEMQHISDRTCALIKERIFTKEISWEQLSHSQKILLIEDVVSIPVKGLEKHRYSRKCRLSSEAKKGVNNEEYRLVTLSITFKKISGALNFFSNSKKKMMQFTYQFVAKQEKVTI